MAGSYRHVVNGSGAFIGTRKLDHMGDAFEALEELYGMIWLLAGGDPSAVERARAHYTDGLALAPKGAPVRRSRASEVR